mmetsp:Transcript_20712/g.61787  ORF Transcript_20712/g.61787 Transcript_20712/m.61787 type:complete len:282 (-) Transcript_20712:225-1070(-)
MAPPSYASLPSKWHESMTAFALRLSAPPNVFSFLLPPTSLFRRNCVRVMRSRCCGLSLSSMAPPNTRFGALATLSANTQSSMVKVPSKSWNALRAWPALRRKRDPVMSTSSSCMSMTTLFLSLLESKVEPRIVAVLSLPNLSTLSPSPSPLRRNVLERTSARPFSRSMSMAEPCLLFEMQFSKWEPRTVVVCEKELTAPPSSCEKQSTKVHPETVSSSDSSPPTRSDSPAATAPPSAYAKHASKAESATASAPPSVEMAPPRPPLARLLLKLDAVTDTSEW